MKKQRLGILILIPLVCVGSLIYAFKTKAQLTKSEITFSDPKETIEYFFNQWDFEFADPDADYNHKNNDGTTLKDKFIDPLSQRKKADLYLTSEHHQSIAPDHSSAKVKLLDAAESTDEAATCIKKEFLENPYNSKLKEENVKVFNVDYSGVKVYSDDHNDYEIFKRYYVLIKENNSWVIDDFGQGTLYR